jgi:aryl-alcohol dehydrogenase-like predicted oxidoreductase
MAFAPAPAPVSPLARYRLLSPNAAVRVSPLCLGAMNIGTAWAKMMGAVDKEESFKLLDYFYEQGGNFIDVIGSLERN